MKATHTPFWEQSIHPITGFKVTKYISQEKIDKATRKKHGEVYRAKQREQQK